MAKFDNPLDNIKIASPCSADWDAMVGTERKRYCGECKLNVYNLSEMNQTQAENFILQSEGQVCVRFYRRADGTILTKDCPVGWQKIKNRTKVYATAAASVIFSFLGAIGLSSLFNKNVDLDLPASISKTAGIALDKANSNTKTNQNQLMTMGNISVTNLNQYTLSNGGVSNLAEVGKMIKNQPKR